MLQMVNEMVNGLGCVWVAWSAAWLVALLVSVLEPMLVDEWGSVLDS